MPGLEDDMLGGFASGEETIIKAMFPTGDTKRDAKMLQMISEQNIRAQVPLGILGLFRSRFPRSNVLDTFQREINRNRISLDRKGRLELESILTISKEEEGGRLP